MAAKMQFFEGEGGFVEYGIRHLGVLVLGLGLTTAAFGHGGDGHNHPVDASQMPPTLADSSSGDATSGGSTAIGGSINSLSSFSPNTSGAAGESGGPATEVQEAAPSYPTLSQPQTVPNGTVKDVPTGRTNEVVVLNRPGTVEPRTDASRRIYERAYNIDIQTMNQWRSQFAR